jgi:anti-anti-sigma regulatory factor
MSMNAVCLKADEKSVAAAIHEARAQLSEGEVLLDFSAVRRIDTAGLRALEDLATAAGEKGATVTLRGLNIDVYKVLKVAKVASKLKFTN